MIDDEFLEELRREFLAEGTSLLELWEESFLKLETGHNRSEEISTIFRVAHSFKGGSSAVGYQDLAAFAHSVEDLLSIIKLSPNILNAELVSLLLKCGDAFKQKISFLNGQDSKDWEITVLAFDINDRLLMLGDDKETAPLFSESPKEEEICPGLTSEDDEWQKVLKETNERLGVQLTEDHLSLSEDEIVQEISKQKQTLQAPVELVKSTIPTPIQTKQSVSVKVDASKIDKIMNLVGELVINKSQLANRVEQHKDDLLLEATFSLLEKTIRELQDETLGMRMISMKNLFMKCQRAVRDVSLKLDKKIEFIQNGEEVEIDRSMVELITDPLLHILRNSADHGIAKEGVITLKAEHIGSKIVLTIQDNGRGIDIDRVFRKARENQLVPQNSNISDYTTNEIFQFIMMPGFSTAEKVTDVSGRGVGLDVVKTTIEQLNGKIEIDSTINKGTKFKLILPLTTSIQEGLHVKSHNGSYVFPTEKVLEILAGDKLNLLKDPNSLVMFKYRNLIIPYASLDYALGVAADITAKKMVLILEVDGKYFGIGVDEFVSQVHVVLKPINNIVKTSTGISASCILSHGGVGFVIDTDEVCKLVIKFNQYQNRKQIA